LYLDQQSIDMANLTSSGRRTKESVAAMLDEPFTEAAKSDAGLTKAAGKAIDLLRDMGGFLNEVSGRPLVSTVDLGGRTRSKHDALDVSFQEVVHSVLTEDAEVAKASVIRGTEWTFIRMRA
jgi:hypothetical protein